MNIPSQNLTITLDNANSNKVNISLSNNAFKLMTVFSNDDITIYRNHGTVEFLPIDLSTLYLNVEEINLNSIIPNNTTLNIYTSTSLDRINFSEYLIINEDGTIQSPQGRYVKIKVEFDSIPEEVDILRNKFNINETSQFNSNNNLVFDGEVYIKTVFTNNMIQENIDEGKLFSIPLNKSDFKRIDKLELI